MHHPFSVLRDEMGCLDYHATGDRHEACSTTAPPHSQKRNYGYDPYLCPVVFDRYIHLFDVRCHLSDVVALRLSLLMCCDMLSACVGFGPVNLIPESLLPFLLHLAFG